MLGNLAAPGVRHLYTGLVAIAVGFLGARFVDAREPPVSQPLLSAGETVTGEEVRYPVAGPAKIDAAIVTLAPGQETGWHTHGVPTFGYILEGELTVDYGAKGKRVYRAGDAFLEAIETVHNGHNSGTGPMRILAVFMGADSLPTTVPAPAP